MKVNRLGNYQVVDEQGYFESLASVSNIKGMWFDAVEALRRSFLANWGEGIHSIYIRGSCAKGLAIENVSDIDSFAIFKEGVSIDGWSDWVEEVEKEIRTAFPAVAGVDVDYAYFDKAVHRDSIHAFMIKLQAACIYGDDLADRIDGYRPDAEIAFQSRKLRHNLDVFKKEYPNEGEQEKKDTLGWICRILLRVGMELVMERENRYTRDLYLCYESFSNYYPQKRGKMRQTLEWAINTDPGNDAYVFVNHFGEWLQEKADERF